MDAKDARKIADEFNAKTDKSQYEKIKKRYFKYLKWW